jgi:para-aminobenzoate synthetase component 2
MVTRRFSRGAGRLREQAMLMSDRVLGADGMRILVVDNYDSFVYNLVQYLAQLGAEVIVRRNDAVSPPDLAELNVDGVLISPGPGIPQEAGQSMPLVIACATAGLPLSACRSPGNRCGFGAPIIRAPELLHGKTSEIVHDGSGVLAGLPSPFTATRYHSLAVDEAALPKEIIVTGRSRSGVVMALRHRTLPIDGVQFHPESVLTHGGHRMVANWLVRCGGTVDDGRVAQLSDGVDALRSTAFADV